MFSCNGLVLNYAIIMYNKSKSKNKKIKMDKVFPDKVKYDILPIWENHRAKGGFTPLFYPEGSSSPPDQRGRRVITIYVTYQDLIQIGIFIVDLVRLCYIIFKGKK